MVRRIVLVLALFFVLLLCLGTPLYSVSSPERASARAVLPVEAGTPPAPPHPRPPDLGQVWDNAIARDPFPDLATNSKTGTLGGRISLTFDDGPEPRTTPLILDTLRKHDLKATFFVLGRQVKAHPDLLRKIVEEGHTLGNHTYDHADMSGLSPAQMRLELQSTQEAVDDALGYHYPMVLMRPPYGSPYFEGSGALPVFRRVVRAEGLFPIIWTIDSSDYLFGGNPEALVRGVVRADQRRRKTQRDQVLLLHDIHGQTAQALPEIIAHFEGSGRQFAEVDELLSAKYAQP
ncbi:Peptidoglycan N-acetylglucosamine deacetylase [uncultured Rubrobacteraceae bacterium]|uniref:Peptidoglycan N-acetylglucosamine deacetylase n=1 Tax=uncultured Rubrobacteraceae bacterium TaxID=349277 RepID=A0A6J4QBA1_9ACTN|nr:Peptidoglycan N-acetylglucosamine deacetylase [uncultured Rubrobacteraceae bacterium]